MFLEPKKKKLSTRIAHSSRRGNNSQSVVASSLAGRTSAESLPKCPKTRKKQTNKGAAEPVPRSRLIIGSVFPFLYFIRNYLGSEVDLREASLNVFLWLCGDAMPTTCRAAPPRHRQARHRLRLPWTRLLTRRSAGSGRNQLGQLALDAARRAGQLVGRVLASAPWTHHTRCAARITPAPL